MRILGGILFFFFMGSAWVVVCAAETPPPLQFPTQVVAGEAITLANSGSGPETFYLIGPGHVAKREIKAAGNGIQLSSSDLAASGTYQAIICDGNDCATTGFYVAPNRTKDLVFLVHPSRVPVGASNAISAVAVALDRFNNLVLQPEAVTFRAATKENVAASPPQMTHDGIAWTRLNSGMKDGIVDIGASLGQLSERRVVQQVAAEPCHLHVSADQKDGQVVLQTEPVRDCRGNAVPDGTVVTFTKVDRLGRSTVDAPIKKGVAHTEMAFAGPATISVACGVVLGNDVKLGGPR
jgi:hypothetical protein